MTAPLPYPPVLVLTGAGLTASVATRLVDELTGNFEVVGPWKADIAVPSVEHALGLLDDAVIDRAHVVGLSFGGVLAQELAIEHPERVRSLVLGATSAGGARYAAPEPRVRQFLRRLAELPPEEGLWATVPYLYAADTLRHRAPLVGEDIARRLSRPVEPRTYRRQHSAARAHNASGRLARITVPTLVIHGEHDRIVPLENARLLAAGIAGAQLVTLPGGAHAILTDVLEAAREIVDFLVAHARWRAGSAPMDPGHAQGPSRTARVNRA